MKTILAVDDDLTILTSIRSILSGKYEVSLAKSAEMGWTILKNTKVDLILLDVEMPNVSGLEFMEILKQLSAYYYLPVIFVTSHATEDIIRRANEAGANDFIVKPFPARILLDKIETVLSKVQENTDEKDILIHKLHSLNDACKKGLSGRIEDRIIELAKIHYNLDMDRLIIEIEKYTSQLEYKEAIEKIDHALEILSR